jgi:hypothetical protein
MAEPDLIKNAASAWYYPSRWVDPVADTHQDRCGRQRGDRHHKRAANLL